MSSKATQRILSVVDQLIAEGKALLKTEWTQTHMGPFQIANPATYVDLEGCYKWLGGCQNLLRMLGKCADAWRGSVANKGNSTENVSKTLGTLQAIRDATAANLLVTVEDLVFAEAFADLLEQADYLLGEGYFLPAGVLSRAVLEEHLRKWCDRENCSPQKQRPTLNDFKTELQKASHITKIEAQQIDALGGVGNDCAHNLGQSTKADVERLVREVRGFLEQHPLP